MLLVAQSATARAIGGPEMRENFSTRILVRYTLNAWRMLVPEVSPVPKPTTHPGRVQIVLGGTAHETQVLSFTDAEAHAWASSGTPAGHITSAPLQPDTPSLDKALADPADPPPPGTPTSLVEVSTEPNPSEPPPADPGEALVGLRQAQQHHLPDIPLAALRWARANDPDFPPPADKRGAELLYRVAGLQRWACNRPRATDGSAG